MRKRLQVEKVRRLDESRTADGHGSFLVETGWLRTYIICSVFCYLGQRRSDPIYDMLVIRYTVTIV